ncbi:MFS transporter [Rhizobium sp. EC-SD404]|uniref:MFS transporter n=1 Tax=Rhizobium sp. EC-SD404 TaxID=2038389 RepID=UPI001255F0A6|nr:MFS transporter [Rhizobium sp. EC-SD404]VVT06372.1 MFS transporter [Rhizobium sp. EC-SD404]
MARNLLPIFALLLGTAFLLAGNGLHGLLLPMRGSMEGFSSASLGLLGTSWASGFVLGCLLAPRLVKRIGHVRAFSAFAAGAAIVALLTGLFVDPIAWILLRALTGFSMAAVFMVIESWLNERSTNDSRGMVFSLYMTITYVAIVAGQMSIAAGDISTPTFFMIAGILYCMALLPTAISTAVSPSPLREVRLDLKGLYRNSPVACVSIFLIGVANGAFGTLGPVFAAQVGLAEGAVASLMSVTIFAGAVAQFPAGRLSDRVDRRYVLAAVAALAGIVGILMLVTVASDITILFVLIALYGAASYTLYPIAVAHANDFARSEDFVKVSGSLLLLYGIGTIVGPTIGGPAMDAGGPHAIFAVTLVSHLSIAVYAILRSRRRAAVPDADKEAFKTLPSIRVATQQGIHLDPRANVEAPAEPGTNDRQSSAA